MKKTIIFIFLIFLVACNNPFKKYEDSVSELQKAMDAAQTISTEVDKIQNIFDSIALNADPNEFTPQQISDLYTSLNTISQNLDNPIVQSILEQYKEQNADVDLDSELTNINTQIDSYDYVGENPSKEDVKTLLANIVADLPQ